jgi:hypothetical protein
MKLKSDFVTNSSSTCFCAWGTTIDFDELVSNSTFIKFIKENFEDVDLENDDRWDIMGQVCDKFDNLDVFFGDDYTIIGINPANMPDDMTAGDAKKYVKDCLEKLGIDAQVEWVEEISYS